MNGGGNNNGVLNNLIFKPGTIALREDSVGYFHNLTILQMHYDEPTLLTDSNTYLRTDLLDSVTVYQHRNGLFTENSDTLETNTKTAIENRVKEYIDFCMENDDFSECPNNTFWNQNSTVFSMISSYAENVSEDSSEELLWNYTNKYLNALINSNLTNNQKAIIAYCVLVGYSSSKLWKSNI